MSLSAALNSARTSLATTSTQTSIISRNIGGANDLLYTKKSANLSTFSGGVRIESIGRTTNAALFNTMLGATSRAAGQQAIVEGLGKLEETVGDPESGQSPAAKLGALRNSMQLYASRPDDPASAQSVLSAAHDVVETLHSASEIVQGARQQADAAMRESVGRVNTLLSRFETVNNSIVTGNQSGSDVTEMLDSRDKILSELSEEIGVRVVTRPYGDYALYTDGGVTLFETRARTVSMDAGGPMQPTAPGQALFIDGVPVTGDSAVMPIKSGRLAGLATFRDGLALTYQNQLDEVARGLIEVFAESDQGNPPTLPTIPGLFTYSGAPLLPASGISVPGLAADLAINPNADPAQGGAIARLRDGGIGDPTAPGYRSNVTGASAFSGRLQNLLDAFGQQRDFDPAAASGGRSELIGFASASVGWLGAARQSASSEVEYRQALLARSSEALSNATGVNIEEEMTRLLEIERSYQASAKLISTVDTMFASLLAAVG